MTPRPRPYHRAEAERLLDYADEWAAQAGEPMPEAGELSCLDRAQVHALLAIHDALADLKPEPVTVTHPWSNPLTVAHPWPPWPSTLPDVDAADRYAANEAKQREAAEPDPLALDEAECSRCGETYPGTAKATLEHHRACTGETPENPMGDARFGPLTFAPDAEGAPSVTAPVAGDPADDAVDGKEADGPKLNAQTRLERLLCPECGHGIDSHGWEADYAITCCLACDDPADCRKAPSDIARALIRRAVEQAGGGRG